MSKNPLYVVAYSTVKFAYATPAYVRVKPLEASDRGRATMDEGLSVTRRRFCAVAAMLETCRDGSSYGPMELRALNVAAVMSRPDAMDTEPAPTRGEAARSALVDGLMPASAYEA